MKASDAVAPGRRRRWGRAILVGRTGRRRRSSLLVVAMFMYRGFGAAAGRRSGLPDRSSADDGLRSRAWSATRDAQSQQFYQQVAERARAVSGVTTRDDDDGRPDVERLARHGDDRARGLSVSAGQGERRPSWRRGWTSTTSTPWASRSSRAATSAAPTTRTRRAWPIVNEHLAQHYWPNQDPLGKRFRAEDADNAWVEIVGVAKTSKYVFIAEPPSDFVYLPYRHESPSRCSCVAQSSGDPAALAAPLREVVRGLDVNMPIFNVRTMEELYQMRAISIFNVLDHDRRRDGADGAARCRSSGSTAWSPTRPRAARARSASGWRSARRAPRCCAWCCGRDCCWRWWGWSLGLAGSIGAGRLLDAAFPSGDQSPRHRVARARRAGRARGHAARGLHSGASRRRASIRRRRFATSTAVASAAM